MNLQFVSAPNAASRAQQDSNISLLIFIEVYSNISRKHFLLSHLAIGSFCQYLLSLDQNSSRASHEALKQLSIDSGERSGELCRSSIEVNLKEPQFRKETWYQHGSTIGCLGGVQYSVPSLDFRIPQPRILGANCTNYRP